MKVELDENLPCDRLVGWVSVDNVLTVEQEGLSGCDDATVWEAAQREERFFVTQDLDFSDLRKFIPGTHHGLLLLRLRDPSRRRLNERLDELLNRTDIGSWSGCFVVATDSKVRVQRPEPDSRRFSGIKS